MFLCTVEILAWMRFENGILPETCSDCAKACFSSPPNINIVASWLRMARFGREAQVLASLNHPNIASIHGLEESGGKRVLVMER